jgi:hypothetical protein
MKVDGYTVRNLHAYGGASIVALGAGWVYPPAGVIVMGVFLAWLGLYWGRPSK